MSKLASERCRAQKWDQIQEAKFPGLHRSFELADHSHSWWQYMIFRAVVATSLEESGMGLSGKGWKQQSKPQTWERTAAWWGEDRVGI